MHQNDQYQLHPQQIEEFQRKGFIRLKGVVPRDQLKEFRAVMNAAVVRVTAKKDKQQRIDDYSSIFTQVTNLWRIDPASRPFVLSKRFATIASQLLGVQKVRIYHDQALVKQSKAGKTPWHQDYFYWPIDSHKTITMWAPMHDCPKTMGTMRFAAGSHLSQGLVKMPISEDSEVYFETEIKRNRWQVQGFDLEEGDATFHYGSTLHCAYGNGEPSKREAMTIIWFQDGARVVPQKDMNSFREVDLSVFCPGAKCGQVIESEFNPIV